MAFAYNVITASGAALIAQATAANPIVFIQSLAGTVAASDADDLASKTAAFYDIGAGVIFSASATGTTARIIMAFKSSDYTIPPGETRTIRSACILGRLASQTDAEAVIVAAVSSPDSTIALPGSDMAAVSIHIPINITIDTGEQVATVGAQYASMADLARFVSMYKAGNPTAGESQTILGIKTFEADVRLAHAGGGCELIFQADTAGSYNTCRLWAKSDDGSESTHLVFDFDGDGKRTTLSSDFIPDVNVSHNLGNQTHQWARVYTASVQTAILNTSSYISCGTDITAGGQVSVGTDLSVGNNCNISGKGSVDGDLDVAGSLAVVGDSTFSGDLTVSYDLTAQRLYGELHGCPPHPSTPQSTTVTISEIPVGCIFKGYFQTESNTHTIGEQITTSGTVLAYVANSDGSASSYAFPTGAKFVLLECVSGSNTFSAMAMRID